MGKKHKFSNGSLFYHYTYPELLQQVSAVKRTYKTKRCEIKQGVAYVFVLLRPTDVSQEYTIQIVAKQGESGIRVFVRDPIIGKEYNGVKIPHIYPKDGALCLYYPAFNEWSYFDSWAETIIPWASLWLFYYEVWKETGEWKGGGHGFTSIKPETE